MTMDASKEVGFYADSKYVKSIKFNVSHQKLRAWENLPAFKKGVKHPQEILLKWYHRIQRMREFYCSVFKLPSVKI